LHLHNPLVNVFECECSFALPIYVYCIEEPLVDGVVVCVSKPNLFGQYSIDFDFVFVVGVANENGFRGRWL
jgi:hypothetical protein